jgi:hypothetical protein
MNPAECRRTGAFALLLLAAIAAFSAFTAPALALHGTEVALVVVPGETYRVPVTLSLGPEDPGGSYDLGVAGLRQSVPEGTYFALDPADDTGETTARPFITLDEDRVQMEPGGRVEIQVTISIPEGARNGGRYAGIVVREVTSDGPQEDAPAAIVPVLLTLEGGPVSEGGEITGIAFVANNTGEGLQVATLFMNTGDYHLSGLMNTVTLSDASGTVISRAESGAPVGVLLPGQEMVFSVEPGGSVPQGLLTLTTRVRKPDGTILAEEEETIAAGDLPEPSTSPPASAPGFGACLGVLAVAVLAGMVKRPPPGRITLRSAGTGL